MKKSSGKIIFWGILFFFFGLLVMGGVKFSKEVVFGQSYDSLSESIKDGISSLDALSIGLLVFGAALMVGGTYLKTRKD